MCKREDARKKVEEGIVADKINCVQVKPYTIVELYSVIDGKTYRGVGLSRQGKNDAWNRNMGYQIAEGRAVVEIAKKAQLL